MNKTLNTIMTAALVTGGTLSTTAQAQQTLSFAHFVPPAHVVTEALVNPLQSGLQADSNGELALRVYPGGELGAGPAEQYVRALQGVADMTWGLAGYNSSQFRKSMVVEMPGAIPEGMGGHDLLWNAFDDHLAGEFPGTRPLALYVSEPNVFIMRNRDIRSPEDLQGLRMRVSGSMAGELMETFGATPVQMPAGEMYSALQTGLIDGIVTGASAITDFQLDEVANSYTIGAPMGHIMFYLVMNQGAYDGLSEAQQAVLDAHTGRGLSEHAEATWNDLAERTLEAVSANSRNTVIHLTEDEIEPFETLVEAFRVEYLDAMGAQDILNAMRGE